MNQLKKVLIEVWDEDILGDKDFLGEVELEFDDIGKTVSTLQHNRTLSAERKMAQIE